MFARTRYLNVYSPTGSCSKKKFVAESRISSYQPMPRSHLYRDTALSGSKPARARVAQVDVFGGVLGAERELHLELVAGLSGALGQRRQRELLARWSRA